MGGFAIRTGAVGVGFVALTAIGSPQTAQQAPQQQPPPIFRGGANIVRVDVTVTNRRGEPATGLTRDDFVVTEDGVPQTIDSFDLVRATGEPTDDRSLEIYTTSQAATEAARDDVRLFLIFWDEYHIDQFIPATRARQLLTDFVRTGFGPTDLVAIMDQLTTVEAVRFTRDRLELANQIHGLKGRLDVLVPIRSAAEEAQLQSRDIGRLRNEVTTSALTAAAAFLGNFRDGRKALLFVSQGVPIVGRNDETDQYRAIVRTANTNNTAIYTLDPSSDVGRRPDSLVALAEETGGRPFVGSNRPDLQLPQMVLDSSAYYLLGYRSPAPTDGKFHRIKVRTNKEGYEIRARSGYFAPSVGDMERGRAAAAAGEVPSDIERALGELALNERSDHPIDYWIGMARSDHDLTRVSIAWAPRTSASSTGGAIALAIQASSPDGVSYFSSAGTTSRQLSFDAPAGDLVLKMKALDAHGEEIDGISRRLTVAVFDGSKLAIGSPMVFRTRTAREARAVADGGDGQAEARREFDRSDRLFIRFPVYGGQDTAVAARLLTRQGKELRALPVAPIREGIYQLDVALSVSLREDYVVAIDATRGTESARALVPFRVR